MPSKMINDDLRSIKTKGALHKAMFSILKSQNFNKTSVKEICEQACISRAAFYAHFIDKYDLLKHFISDIINRLDLKSSYQDLEQTVNTFLAKNSRMLTHLIYDADNETLNTLFELVLEIGGMNTERNTSSSVYQKNIVLNNFFAGGVIAYVTWFVKNRYPADIEPINKYLFKMLTELKDWQPKL